MESVLSDPAEEPHTLVEQLEHLVKLLDLPTVTIQVLPLEVGVHAGIDGTFTVLTSRPNCKVTPIQVHARTPSRPGPCRSSVVNSTPASCVLPRNDGAVEFTTAPGLAR
ncbi:MAG TPA: Scr1 family TA system antitoxin-like transcriptional regulator [Pseudonocardiaceae bacterium]|nr:Scr1 family TA system antitoxin-like transcriptional regulator [Pseudonocardiaceae bacterium]